jgi:hypothetical protein
MKVKSFIGASCTEKKDICIFFQTTEKAVMINEELDAEEVRVTINYAIAKGLLFIIEIDNFY